MKIVYVSGYSRMVLFNKLIPKALREIGYEVFEFDWNSIYKFNKIINLVPDDSVKKKINSELLKFADVVKPDYIFVLKGEPIFTETLKELKNRTEAVLFNWFGDDPWEYPLFSGKVAPYYDFFFTYDPYSVKLYKEDNHPNPHHLCYAYDLSTVESLEINDQDRNKYSCDVAFIGSHYPKREELLSQIKNKYDLKIWGRGWKNTSCSNVYEGSALYGKEMLKAMKCCKILLNIHKGFEEGIQASGSGLNLRVIEGAASGAFQLTNFQGDLPNRFEIGKENESFETWAEAVEKIGEFLNDDQRRNSIASSAFERFKKDHQMPKRFKEMFDIIQD